MTTTYRPHTHDERDEVISAVATWRNKPDTEALVIQLMDEIYTAAQVSYSEKRAAYRRAEGKARQASQDADDGDVQFDHTFKRWYRTVQDDEGKVLSHELSVLLGGVVPSVLVKRPYREELTRTHDMMNKVDEQPGLRGDPARYSELQAVVANFDTLVTADEQAERQSLAEGSKLAGATAAFDRAYGKMYRALSDVAGEQAVLAALPRFVRKEPKETK